ncbi:MAG: vWA domain-containing protein [Pseudanabaenaceae cyanobacterium]
MLENRDYTLIIDKSGSMSTRDQAGGKSRWQVVQESTIALARKCEEFDPDGITVYTFASRYKRYEHVNSQKVEQIFRENDPVGGTNLTSVLQDAINHFLAKRAQGNAKQGETILVITDGEPDDRRSVLEVIINATKQLQSDEELAISFIQVGSDPQATQFLRALDDQLTNVGAKFDIVDTITVQDMEDMSLSEVLLNAITD